MNNNILDQIAVIESVMMSNDFYVNLKDFSKSFWSVNPKLFEFARYEVMITQIVDDGYDLDDCWVYEFDREKWKRIK